MNSNHDHHEYCTGGYDPEDIVICGISGRFPSCNNVGELSEGLYEKKQMIFFTDERYKKGFSYKSHTVPYGSCGIVKDIDKIDIDFFGFNANLANEIDPGSRTTLEVVYETIVDAGYDPTIEFKGKKVGVYHAIVSEDAVRLKCIDRTNISLVGTRSMTPNRITYVFDLKGPSHTVDSACSSSGVAFHEAVCDLRSDRISAAVVSSSHINLDPQILAMYIISGICTTTGNSNPFDASSDGMIRSDAVASLLLMKAKDARRVYAKVCATGYNSAGHMPEGISVPSSDLLARTVKDTLEEAHVNADDIDFIETHGTGTIKGDPIELNAMADVYCHPRRNKPLFVGTIKSSIGHTEASSANCGLIKTCLAMENNLISPNLRYSVPNPGIQALLDGRLKVVTEPLPLTSPYIMVDSLGLGGTVLTMLLKQNHITYEDRQNAKSDIPRLIMFPSTTEEGIQIIFDYVEKHQEELKNEFYALIDKLSFTPLQFKAIRGYCVFKDNSKTTQSIKSVSCNPRPVWWILTGMGCQWSGMGLQLMKIKVFAQSMYRSAEILKPNGVDLFAILQPNSDLLHVDRRIVPAFVSIASIQVALIDLLKYLDIPMDGVVGHSTGDLMCAYADGCCTQEQIILASFWRGKAVEAANLTSGAMAAVGLSWKEASELCPKGVYPACDNAEDSVTISGLKEPVKDFVEKLQGNKVFARTVNCYGFAFHCPLVHPAAQALKNALNNIISHPKPRSERWVSSSYPEHQWNEPSCKTVSSEYFVHNLISPVLFREAIRKIPPNAIVVEVAPHFLLQSILKRMIGSEATFVGLMERNREDNISFFLESIGKLYNEGVNPKIERLYPSVQFPVPRKTPMISNLIRWKHDQSFYVPKYKNSKDFSCEFDTFKDSYILDHQIDGRSLFPATGYVCLVWEALCNQLMKPNHSVPFVLENFKIHKATILAPKSVTNFHVWINQSKTFELTESNSLVASGEIYENKSMSFSEPEPNYNESSSVSGKDIYNEIKMAGYEYGPAFQNLLEVNMNGTSGLVLWRGKWIPFLDSLLLFFGILNNSIDFCLPTGALSFQIDPEMMTEFLKENGKLNVDNNEIYAEIPVSYNHFTRTCRSVGIEITKLDLNPAPHRKTHNVPSLEEYKFIPYSFKFTPSTEISEKLLHYMCACNNIIENISKATGCNTIQEKFPIRNVQNFDLENYLNDLNDVHSLLSVLKDISENIDSVAIKRINWFSNYTINMGKDFLSNFMLNDDSLRIVVEILSENSFRKQNVVEILRDYPCILPKVVKILIQYAYVKFKKCILIAPNEAEVDHEDLQKANVQLEKTENIQNIIKEKNQDIVITSFTNGSLSDLQKLMKSVSAMLKQNGFALFFYREAINQAEKFLSFFCGEEFEMHSASTLESILCQENLTIVSKISDGYGNIIYLLRPVKLVEAYTIIQIKEDNFSWVNDLKAELQKSQEQQHKHIWLLSLENPTSGIVGMVNCLKQEPGGDRIRCIFSNSTSSLSFNFEDPFYKPLLSKDLVMNVCRDNEWGSYRHVTFHEIHKVQEVDHSYIQCRNYGDLSSFQWVESPINTMSKNSPSLVHVYYTALNFKDVMIASGKLHKGAVRVPNSGLNDDEILGFEYSGRDSTGRRVCGLAAGRGLASSVITHSVSVHQFPDHWSLEEAATVPVVYSTCYYALMMRGRLEEEESILIHSGTGGVGLASIYIALSLNCQIFVTVGTAEKREYLIKKFPQIKEENIGCSRDITFEKMIINRTEGRGVDVVLNSLADEKNYASLRCVADNGRFVEIGKYDLAMDKKLGLKMFLRNISYHGVQMDRFYDRSPSSIKILRKIGKMFQDGIQKGVVQPLDRTVFSKNEVEEAFRYMAKGVHIGKVLVKIRDEEVTKTALPKLLRLPAIPITYFYDHKVYIVIGGLGGFGIEVTKWIISKGGKHVILTSRYGARSSYHYLCLTRWKEANKDVTVSTLDVSIRTQAETLLSEAEKIGPIGGIFNSAVVLKDAFMDAQTADDYREVCGPKATASLHLDELSRKMCPSLDFFVCFSSISCGRGNAGQTNYGYANSVMERICEERRRVGLHGLAIQWGIIGQVGVVHRHMGDEAMIAGVVAQSVKSCLNAMDSFLKHDCAVMSSYMSKSSTKKSGNVDLLSMLAKVLGADDLSSISSTRTFGAMGIDSIVGVEMRQLIEMHCEVDLTVQEILELNIDGVRAMIEKKESEKSDQKIIPSLFTTTSVRLPPHLILELPLVYLNTSGNGEPVFIVQLGDNDIQDFRLLAESLRKPVYALLWTKGLDVADCTLLAQHFLRIIKDTCEGPFHLLGYGFGGCVAFEMALQSEAIQKDLRSITLLNGSEDLISAVAKDETDTKAPENLTVCKFVEQFIPDSTITLLELLQQGTSREQRCKVVVDFLTRSSCEELNKMEVLEAINQYIMKRNIVNAYTPKDKLRKDIHLIEDPTKILANDITEIKKSFAKICCGKINILRIFNSQDLFSKENIEILTSTILDISQ